MFFAALCILTVVLMANHVAIDTYGWLMLMGTGWFAGYMDCRLFQHWDQDKARTLPPDMADDKHATTTKPC